MEKKLFHLREQFEVTNFFKKVRTQKHSENKSSSMWFVANAKRKNPKWWADSTCRDTRLLQAVPLFSQFLLVAADLHIELNSRAKTSILGRGPFWKKKNLLCFHFGVFQQHKWGSSKFYFTNCCPLCPVLETQDQVPQRVKYLTLPSQYSN